jgi:S1-C subfamily serine protease
LDGTIAWGRHRLEDPVVALKSGDGGIAGMQVLRNFRITFDFGHARVRFERAGDEPIRSESVRSPGFRCMYDGGAWTVAYVLPDSPAARAGVHVGDRVETVDGQAVADIGVARLRTMTETGDALRLRTVAADGTTRDVVVDVATLVE